MKNDKLNKGFILTSAPHPTKFSKTELITELQGNQSLIIPTSWEVIYKLYLLAVFFFLIGEYRQDHNDRIIIIG